MCDPFVVRCEACRRRRQSSCPLLMVMFGPARLHARYAGGACSTAPFGFVSSLIAVEFLLRPRRLPLTCSARPAGNLKALGPIYLMLLFVVAYNLGLLERAALGDFRKFAMLLGSLVLIYAGLRLSQRRQSILSRIEIRRSARHAHAAAWPERTGVNQPQRFGWHPY